MYYIIYHKATDTSDCPDGITAAAIVYQALQTEHIAYELLGFSQSTDGIAIIGDTYRDASEYPELPEGDKYPFQTGDTIIIVDFSYPRRWLDYWQSMANTFVIDHHEKKFPQLEGFTNAILNPDECGATLTWKHFFPHYPVPDLLQHIRNRDIGRNGYYQGTNRESEAINEAYGAWRHGFPEQDKVGLLENINRLIWDCRDESYTYQLYKNWIPIGESLLKQRDQVVETACERATTRLISDGTTEYVVPFVMLYKHEARYYSTIGNKLAKRHPECSFAWVQTPDGHALRSTGFDTSGVARYHGGDGHPQASGFKYEKQPPYDLDKVRG